MLCPAKVRPESARPRSPRVCVKTSHPPRTRFLPFIVCCALMARLQERSNALSRRFAAQSDKLNLKRRINCKTAREHLSRGDLCDATACAGQDHVAGSELVSMQGKVRKDALAAALGKCKRGSRVQCMPHVRQLPTEQFVLLLNVICLTSSRSQFRREIPMRRRSRLE